MALPQGLSTSLLGLPPQPSRPLLHVLCRFGDGTDTSGPQRIREIEQGGSREESKGREKEVLLLDRTLQFKEGKRKKMEGKERQQE